MLYNLCRDALDDTTVRAFRASTVSLPPWSDIPDRAVRGRGALLARKSHFTAAIRNVLTFLEPYKSLVIMSQIFSLISAPVTQLQLVWLRLQGLWWSFSLECHEYRRFRRRCAFIENA